MSDYKFDILTILVKHDGYESNTTLFGDNIKKYEETLEHLYDFKLIDRDILVGDYEFERTKITVKGRSYYYDELLPLRQNIREINQPIVKQLSPIDRIINWLSDNIFNIIGVIIGLIGLYLAYLALS